MKKLLFVSLILLACLASAGTAHADTTIGLVNGTGKSTLQIKAFASDSYPDEAVNKANTWLDGLNKTTIIVSVTPTAVGTSSHKQHVITIVYYRSEP
ncbi:MAG: hypothetical protein WC763_01435 [Candidatus Paceibacterota bacterium]|jgi:hypothetical protein